MKTATDNFTDRDHLIELICRAILTAQAANGNVERAAKEAAAAFHAGLKLFDTQLNIPAGTRPANLS